MESLRDQFSRAVAPRYRIDAELDGGGMARVFLATETALGRHVVLKVLPDLSGGLPLDRFAREISVSAQLQHPHIVPLLTAGESDGLRWYAMPFVQGETLRASIARGALDAVAAMQVMRDVASALAHAHANGIVHRDIKPDNVLLTDGGAMVTDFGVARAITASADVTMTAPGIAVGTPAYMSPEQASGEPGVDHRADIYSLGMVAFEMLSGRNAFAGKTLQSMLAAHRFEPPPSLDTIRPPLPPLLVELVARCLAKSPADRPQSAEEVVVALNAILTDGVHHRAQGPARSRLARPWTQRLRPWAAPALALVALALGRAAWPVAADPAPVAAAPPSPALPARGPVEEPQLEGVMGRPFVAVPAAPQRVAILPFENLTQDSSLNVIADIAAEELAAGVLQAGFKLVDPSALRHLTGIAPSATAELTPRLQQLGATLLVRGSYLRRGDSLRLQATVSDVATGGVLYLIGPEWGPVADPVAALQGLRQRLLGGVVTADVAKGVSVVLHAPRFDALLAYARAHRLSRASSLSNPCPQPVREGYAAAIAADSMFIEPFVELIRCDNYGSDAAQRLLDRLMAMSPRLSAYDRLQVEFARSSMKGSFAESLRLARRLFELTRSPEWALEAGTLSVILWQPHLALQYLERSDSVGYADGYVGQFSALQWAYHLLGNYRTQLAVLDRAARASDLYDGRLVERAFAYAGLHDTPAVLAFIDSVADVPPTSRPPLGVMQSVLAEVQVHGDPVALHAAGLRVVAALRAATPYYAAQGPAGLGQQALAMSQAFRVMGDADSARVHFARAVRPPLVAPAGAPDSVERSMLIAAARWGAVAAFVGDTAVARALADSIPSLKVRFSKGQKEYWRASLLAELGRRDEAVELLRESLRLGNANVGWHRAFALIALRGYPPFERLIHPER